MKCLQSTLAFFQKQGSYKFAFENSLRVQRAQHFLNWVFKKYPNYTLPTPQKSNIKTQIPGPRGHVDVIVATVSARLAQTLDQGLSTGGRTSLRSAPLLIPTAFITHILLK